MNKKAKTWKGRTARDIVGSFGPPDLETSDEAGGRIFVYEDSSTDSSSSWTSQIIGDKVYHDSSGPYEVKAVKNTLDKPRWNNLPRVMENQRQQRSGLSGRF